MPKTKKPNILILWGDDIGWWNISYNSRGQMGYRTPNIDRIANEGVAFTDYYGQQSCTAGRAAFITGQNPIRTGLTKVGMPGADVGLQRRRSDDRRTAEAARLRHRPVRQEPSRRQGRVPADDARLRRILRQSLSPQRRGGARGSRLSEGPGVQEAFRAARRAALQGRRQGRTDDRGHRTADQEADGDDRRRGDRTRAQVHRRDAQGRQALLPLVQHHRHAFPHAPGREAQGQEQRPGRLQRRDGRARRAHRPDARTSSTSSASPTTRSSCTRRTTACTTTAGRTPASRRSAPRRTPTGKAAGACRPSCAGPASSRRARCSTASSATRTGCRRSSPPRESRTSRRSSSRATRSATRPTRSTSTASTCCRI